jgi:hypothetical protein
MDPQAFPAGDSGDYPGMSLRDYFAASIMTGMISTSTSWRSETPEHVAQIAYMLADAMLVERLKPLATT